MNETREERSDVQDTPDRSPETEIDENGGESLLASNARPEKYEDKYLEDPENIKKKKRNYTLIAILLGVIAATGFFLWFTNYRNRGLSDGPSPGQQAKQTNSNRRSKAIDAWLSSQKTKQPETHAQVGISGHKAFGLADKLEKATRLRNELLKKQEEIRALKHYYRNRIKEVRAEILNEKRKEGITTFQKALKSKRIELGLRTIRRRHFYINKLNRPLAQLHRGSEELLYIERLAGIQIQMAPIVNGIDIAKLGKRMDIIIEKEASGVDSLAIDTRETSAPSLKEIWKEIVHAEDMKRKPEREAQKGETLEKGKAHSQREDKINMGIWQEICVGNLSRKYELAKLSLNAAKCLSQWEGKNLFLNGITELPAAIAGQLAQWEGEWLCLNGLTELSPEAAEGLSRWRGIRLSLNGLIEIAPQAAKHLSQWRGKEIEIVGVAKISAEADKYLTAWQKAGGKIYIRTLP